MPALYRQEQIFGHNFESTAGKPIRGKVDRGRERDAPLMPFQNPMFQVNARHYLGTPYVKQPMNFSSEELLDLKRRKADPNLLGKKSIAHVSFFGSLLRRANSSL